MLHGEARQLVERLRLEQGAATHSNPHYTVSERQMRMRDSSQVLGLKEIFGIGAVPL
jgi:hypothetical protein